MTKKANHIILVGFMGSGKSTIARRLARKLSMSSLDVDNYIQRLSGMTIPQIFATEGEAGFRARETELLQTMFDRERTILSCGGGVISTKENRDLLKQLGWVVYLQVDVAEVINRISDTNNRPLLGDEAAIQELMTSRESLYLEVADAIVNTNGIDIAEVTSKVVESLTANAQL